MPPLVKPSKLCAGDKVAAVSLSWGGAFAFPERYALGKKRIEESYGVQIVESAHALRDPAWLSANPEARAADLMQSFADRSIKAIFSIIGGEDSIRILPFIDFDVIRANPKIFMGFSDTTISHFICHNAGLSSFYGPSIMGSFDENVELFPYTLESVRRMLFFSEPLGLVEPNHDAWTGQMLPWNVPENAKIKRMRSKPSGPRLLQGKGKGRGRLIGGCIDVLDWLRGTQVWPSAEIWDGALLFLETSEERPLPREFARWLRCLAALGVLQRLNGILVGRPMCDPDPAQLTQYDTPLIKILAEECGRPDLPILSQMDFGHSDPKMVLPMGALAEIDCERATFSLLEGGVV